MFDKYPYTNFHELNLEYFIQHFKEIFDEWEELYNTLTAWKDATDAANAAWKTGVETDLATWKAGVEADLTAREAALRAELEAWKDATEADIDTWESDTLATLEAWKAYAEAAFEVIRLQAAASATAAAGSATAAATSETNAAASASSAATDAASIAASAAQIAENASDIANLENALEDVADENNELWGKVYNEYDTTQNVRDIATITDNSYMNPANGQILENTSYETDEISLENVDKIFTSVSNSAILSYSPINFLDENDVWLSGYQPILQSQDEKVTYNNHSGVYYVIPANAKKAVICVAKSRISITYLITIKENRDLEEVLIPYYKKKDNPFYKKKIVNFGDSIFGNFRDTNETTDKSISKMIEEATGATVYNAGFGGCRMSVHSTPWNAFSMYSLADSIASGDWTVQDNALTAGLLPDYFAETVAMLKTLDFSQIDFITIGYGTNDYSGNVFIKSTDATFTYEYQYFEGALKYSIRTILNAFPNLKIIVISPCWKWFPDSDGAYSYSADDAQSENTRHYFLYDYVNACKDVCEEYHIPYIDTYYTLGFNQYSINAYFPVKGVDGYTVSDGTHPKQNGRQLRADRIVGQMESLY